MGSHIKRGFEGWGDYCPNPRYWEERTCLHCGAVFYVRKCYTKRGQGTFCSTSCGVSYRNLTDNPAKRPEVRAKISANHADVSGINSPMYGKRPASYIDGRSLIAGGGYRGIAYLNKEPKCEKCGVTSSDKKLHVHHIDGDRKNNELDNLQVLCASCHLKTHYALGRRPRGKEKREANYA